jgi:ribosomal protein L13
MANRSTTSEFVSKSKVVHGETFDYSKVVYVNNESKIIITCKKHGEFCQTPSGHLSGKNGCKKCFSEKIRRLKSSNTEDFINKSKSIHRDRYDYSKVIYINNFSKVTITCKKHG